MCYNGTLVMPSNYAVVTDNEMEYVEGGGTLAITLKKDFLRDLVTASCSAIGIIVGTIIVGGSSGGTAAVVGGAIGGALGWIIGGTLSRKFINKDLKFSVWVPFVPNKTWIIH